MNSWKSYWSTENHCEIFEEYWNSESNLKEKRMQWIHIFWYMIIQFETWLFNLKHESCIEYEVIQYDSCL